MQARRTVGIVRRCMFHHWDLTHDIGADGVHDVFTHQAATVGDAIGKHWIDRVQQDSRGLAAAGSEDDSTRSRALMLAGELVDKAHAFCFALLVCQYLINHGMGANGEISGRQ